MLDGDTMLLAVYRAAERVTAELHLPRALEEIIACVRSPLGLDRAGVFIFRPRRRDLVRLIGIGPDGAVEHGPEVPILLGDGSGPMQQVALGRIPFFHSHDVSREVAPEHHMPPGLGAHAIVPLVNRGEIIGVMAVDNLLTQRDIPVEMVHPLRLFANFAALALGNALRAHDLGDVYLKLRRLTELSGACSSGVAPDLLLQQLLDGVPELLHADRYSVWRRREGIGWECIALRGLSDVYQQAVADFYQRKGRRECLMERFVRSGEPVFVADVYSSTRLRPYAGTFRSEGFRSVLLIPLRQGSELLGCINLYYNEPPDLSEQDWEITRLLARQASSALRNAELLEARADLDDELQRVTQELHTGQQQLLDRQEELRHGETLKQQFYRDVLYCMTNGKILLCDPQEIARDWSDEVASAVIRHTEDIKCCRELVQRYAYDAGMPDERVNDLCLCTSEATTNALKHAGSGRMSISSSGGLLRVRIADDGPGIDAVQLPRATLMRGFSTRASMGLGFTLMNEMADRLCLATGPEGTTLVLEMAVQPESETDRAMALLKAVEF